MQIREKGRKVLCIRTEYIPEKKRTIGKTVASQDIGLSTVSEEVCRHLEKEEVDQLKQWLSDREEKRKVDRLETSLSILPGVLTRSAAALDNSAELDEKQVDEIVAGLDRLKKSLRNRGIKISKQTKKQSVAKKPDDRQLDIEKDVGE
jgi:hypothetical protein